MSLRFRFREDEQRFMRLHSEIFQRLAAAGIKSEAASEMLRNISKIEMMAHMEGLRQGLAMAGLVVEMEGRDEALNDPYAYKAFQLHAMIYGSSDTPLRAAEKEWLARVGADEDALARSWLDDKPMRFAPETLQEAAGVAPTPAPMIKVQMDHPPTIAQATQEVPPPQPVRLPPPEAMHGAEVTPVGPGHQNEYEPDEDISHEDLVAILTKLDADGVDGDAGETPDFIEEIRDAVQAKQTGGWTPADWKQLILDLSVEMKGNAATLDLQLATPVGQAMLAQCGIHIAPGAMVDLNALVGDGGSH